MSDDTGVFYVNPLFTSSENKISLDAFVIGKELGDGAYGRAHVAVFLETNQTCVLKIVEKEINNMDVINSIRNEYKILSNLKHKNIVSLYAYFETKTACYLVLEHAGKELFQIFSKLQPETIKNYLHQLVDAIEHCHQNNIIHRDLKPENVCIDEQGGLRLIDFGFATTFEQNDFKLCGTEEYLSIEMISSCHYDYRVDIWSFGILVYEIMTHETPFFDGVENKLRSNDVSKLKITYPETIPHDAIDLVSNLLKANPEERISLQDIRMHEFLKNT